jgi:hypothetical protein
LGLGSPDKAFGSHKDTRMYKEVIAALGLGLIQATLVCAQPSPQPLPSASVSGPVVSAPAGGSVPLLPGLSAAGPPLTDSIGAVDGGAGHGACFWTSIDYLMWWVKSGPLPPPLVTVGNALDPIPGGVGQPGSQVLVGTQPLIFHTFSGIRFNGGFWLDSQQRFGIDGSWFGLERRAVNHNFADNTLGNPLYAVVGISNNGLITGGIAFTANTRLQGWDINAAFNAGQSQNYRLMLLAGFRNLSLNEGLTLNTARVPLTPGAVFFGGAPIPDGFTTTTDSFQMYNQFYGGQVGSRLDTRWGCLDLGVVGKVALGTVQELAVINGTSTLLTSSGTPVTVPGGIYALSGNIGRHYHEAFAVVPEANINLGIQVTSQFNFRVGYTFLYFSNVLRPGNQIDPVVNQQAIPTDPTFAPGGPNRPLFTPHESSFWAQGVNLGFEYRF